MERNPTLVRPVKKYYCAACGHEEWDNVTPKGWWSVTRSLPHGWSKYGLYCSLACLLGRVSTLEGNERRAALMSRDV